VHVWVIYVFITASQCTASPDLLPNSNVTGLLWLEYGSLIPRLTAGCQEQLLIFF
jgi:hypothetical protein